MGDDIVGEIERKSVGAFVGSLVVGAFVGLLVVGESERKSVGTLVGILEVGEKEGVLVVGWNVGELGVGARLWGQVTSICQFPRAPP